MNRLSASLAGIASLWLLSCATAQRPEVIQLPAQRIQLRQHSFQPLQEQGWVIVARTDDAVYIGRRGSHLDETLTIRAGNAKYEGVSTQQELLAYVRKLETADPKDKRYRNPTVEVATATFGGAECVVSNVTVEDHGALTASGRRDPMIIESGTAHCRHPYRGDVVVFLHYSQRCYREDRDPAFAEKARSLFDSLEFVAH